MEGTSRAGWLRVKSAGPGEVGIRFGAYAVQKDLNPVRECVQTPLWKNVVRTPNP